MRLYPVDLRLRQLGHRERQEIRGVVQHQVSDALGEAELRRQPRLGVAVLEAEAMPEFMGDYDGRHARRGAERR